MNLNKKLQKPDNETYKDHWSKPKKSLEMPI